MFREVPPKAPQQIGQKIVTISGKVIPPPPRKVLIERLAPLPAPPPAIIVERWLPYSTHKRRVIFQRAPEPSTYLKPRNTIIQWDAPCVKINKELTDLGVVRANPTEYVEKYGPSLMKFNDFPDFIKDIRPPQGLVLAADYVQKSPSLEGDLQALSWIDLDREGLSEYKAYVKI